MSVSLCTVNIFSSPSSPGDGPIFGGMEQLFFGDGIIIPVTWRSCVTLLLSCCRAVLSCVVLLLCCFVLFCYLLQICVALLVKNQQNLKAWLSSWTAKWLGLCQHPLSMIMHDCYLYWPEPPKTCRCCSIQFKERRWPDIVWCFWGPSGECCHMNWWCWLLTLIVVRRLTDQDSSLRLKGLSSWSCSQTALSWCYWMFVTWILCILAGKGLVHILFFFIHEVNKSTY